MPEPHPDVEATLRIASAEPDWFRQLSEADLLKLIELLQPEITRETLHLALAALNRHPDGTLRLSFDKIGDRIDRPGATLARQAKPPTADGRRYRRHP